MDSQNPETSNTQKRASARLNITSPFKQRIESQLKAMPFVTWDRYVLLVDAVEIYGWIDREDSYKDFVCLFFYADGDVAYSTSSTKFSKKIHLIINGTTRDHRACRRVEDYFDVQNMIRLGSSKTTIPRP